jgi:hypothetical protein
VAEGARLESVYTGNRIVGSNPTPSARDWSIGIHDHTKNQRCERVIWTIFPRAFTAVHCYPRMRRMYGRG